MTDTIREFLVLILSASLINNVVLSQFLGLCPFLGVSKKIDTALGMGGACIFVMTLSSLVCSTIYWFVLKPFDLGYLQTIVFILVVAMLVQFVEMILKKIYGLTVQGTWSVSSSYHDKLCGSRCCA